MVDRVDLPADRDLRHLLREPRAEHRRPEPPEVAMVQARGAAAIISPLCLLRHFLGPLYVRHKAHAGTLEADIETGRERNSHAQEQDRSRPRRGCARRRRRRRRGRRAVARGGSHAKHRRRRPSPRCAGDLERREHRRSPSARSQSSRRGRRRDRRDRGRRSPSPFPCGAAARPSAEGTGFVYDTKGDIVTNEHVDRRRDARSR